MKLLNWMFASAVAFSFAACSNNDGIENGANGDNAQVEKGTTYAALSLDFNTKQHTDARANTPGDYNQYGSEAENKVKSLRLIVLNTTTNEVEFNSTKNGDTEFVDGNVWASDVANNKKAFVIKLTPGVKKFYAVLNEDVAFAGTTKADLDTYLTGAVKTNLATVVTANGILMTNVDEVSGYLKNNVTADQAAAGENNISIMVDRVVAKVTVKKSETFTTKNNDNASLDVDNLNFAIGNTSLDATSGYAANQNAFYRMQQHNAESTAWTTPYTDFIPAENADHTYPTAYVAVGETSPLYCFENVHTHVTTAGQIANYRQGNTTYAALRVPVLVNKKARLTYANDKLTVTMRDVTNPVAKSFYFVNAARAPYQELVGQYVLTDDLVTLGASYDAGLTEDTEKVAKAISELKALGISLSKEYTDGYAYYKVWVNLDPATTQAPYEAPVFRNNWYSLTLNSITLPGEPQHPSIDVDEPLVVENNAQIEVVIRGWNLVEHAWDVE